MKSSCSLLKGSKNGFTVLEILVVLSIIGVFVTICAGTIKDTANDAEMIAALGIMNSIRQAVANGFYKDFGCIPEEVQKTGSGAAHTVSYNNNPEYATRFLCLKKDCSDSDIQTLLKKYKSADWTDFNDGDFRPGCCFMFKCLENLVSVDLGTVYTHIEALMTNPVYGTRSWTGPYLEANSQFNATALNQADDTRYPDDFYSDYSTFEGDPVLLPVISTPWSDGLEASALEIEAENPSLAAELRKGRYYQILVYSRNTGTTENGQDTYTSVWIQVPETAVVISRGPDGLPGTDGDAGTVGAETYWKACAAMSDFGPATAQRQCFKRLMITDPNDSEYVDIGDDMILFIFGGGTVRSLLDN